MFIYLLGDRFGISVWPWAMVRVSVMFRLTGRVRGIVTVQVKAQVWASNQNLVMVIGRVELTFLPTQSITPDPLGLT